MGSQMKPRLLCSHRLLFACLSMLGMMMTYMTRSNTSVAIVCMTNATYMDLHANRTLPKCREIEGLTHNGTTTRNSRKDGTFNWKKPERSMILSAFYYSYWTTKFPGGVLERYIGAKWIIFGVVLGSAFFNLLTPLSTTAGYWWFFTDRVLLGAIQGAAFPVMQQMLTSWAPPAERSTIAGIVYTGSQFGIVLAHLLSLVCDPLGWDWIYYITGIMACVWCVLWILLIGDTPDKQQQPQCGLPLIRMSEAEKDYINDALAPTRNKKTVPFCEVPWRKIATSMPVYAVCVAQFTMDFGAFTVAQCMPTFIDDVLRLPLGHTGVIVAIPFAGKMVMIGLSGIVADKVHKCGWLSLVNTRRAAMIIAAVGQTVFLLGAAFLNECSNQYLAMFLLTASVGMSGVQYASYPASYLDIAPAYAGIIVGLSNSLSSISGALGPRLMGVMTQQSTPEQWRGFFGLIIGVVLSGATFYCIFIQAHPQPWAVNPEAKTMESTTTSTPGSDTSGDNATEVSSSIESSENSHETA